MSAEVEQGTQEEKVNNAVLFDQTTYNKLLSEAPKYKQITPSVLSKRLQVISACPFFLLYMPEHRKFYINRLKDVMPMCYAM